MSSTGPPLLPGSIGDGELQHRAAVDIARPQTTPADDAVLQAVRISQRDDRLARLSAFESPSGSGVQVLGVDADEGQVERAVGGVDALTRRALPSAVCTVMGRRLADDVQVRGDQAVLADDEAGAQAFLLTVAAGEA